MATSIVSVDFLSTGRKALRWDNGIWSRPHGISSWTTIAFGAIWRVAANGATLTGSPQFNLGFKSNVSGPPGINPGHFYYHYFSSASWSWSVSTYNGVGQGMAKVENASSSTLVSSAINLFGNASTSSYNASIVIISKSAPTTSSGVVFCTSSTGPSTLIQNMINALDSGSRASAASALSSQSASTLVPSTYTIDEATYGNLTDVFVYWNYAAESVDLTWTGVAKWA